MEPALRSKITSALKIAMKEKDSSRLSTLRLISAAIKDRDIDARAGGNDDGVGDDEVMGILGKMVRQRGESAKAYEEGGRIDLAEQERAEIAVIEEFLPQRLTDAETDKVIESAIGEIGAEGIRDMGRVMALLKERYVGQLDFGTVGPKVKTRLCAN